MTPNFAADLHTKLTELSDVVVDRKTLEKYTIYRLNPKKYPLDNVNKLNFAIIKDGSRPLLVDLACDPNLAQLLRGRYESVVPSKLMDEVSWNQIIGSGQISAEEIFDLVRLAYDLVKKQVSEQL